MADEVFSSYDDIDAGKVLNKVGLLELSGQIKGYISANMPSTYTLPTASTSTLGGVKVDGTTITISNGVISANFPTYTAGTNISISNGVISATDTTYTAGTGISISNGVISATNTAYTAGTGISISSGVISSELPARPDADGYYVLRRGTSVANGTTTYSWESITVGGSY